MKRIVACVGAAAVVCALGAPAYATNGYQLIGVGQIQKSMGGAVTAAPMDTMTAISNPAGMARVGQRADFSMEAFMPVREVDFTGPTLGGNKENGGSELYGVPSVGWVAKAFGRDDMYFGGGMFATSGLGVDYGEVTMMPAGALGPGTSAVTFDGYSSIQFWKMAPTVAWRVNDALSLGASANVDYQSVTIRQTFRNMPFGTGPFNQMDVNFDLSRPTNQLGLGATLGALYDVHPMVTLGLSYSTKQNFADGVYRVGTGDLTVYNGATGTPGRYRLNLDYPQQLALGVAVRPADTVLVDLDVKWINWNATHDRVSLVGPAGAFGASNSTVLDFGWNDQMVYALGVQWLATDALTLRAGYNYGKAPIDAGDVMNNLIFPALAEQHATVGFDYRLGDHWGVGATFMQAFKETVTGVNDVPPGFRQPTTPFGADSGFTISLEETSAGVLLYYLF